MPTGHAKATTPDGTVLAESDTWELVEGNVYFPPAAVTDPSVLVKSDLRTHCGWKGEARYYSIKVGDNDELANAAWYYPEPYEKALHIKDYIAFYKTKVNVSTS
ncbi:DUF427-domain-containing protein [Biscogniauxia mediterranea]|nr:DUF427-domain-containing protein [Biscogniauxia mediterranea]